MEFSSLWYLSLCSIISQVFLLIALLALTRVKTPIFEVIWDNFVCNICGQASLSYLFAFFVLPMKEPDLTTGNVSDELRSFFISLMFVSEAAIYFLLFFWYQKFSVFQIVAISLITLVLVHVCFHFIHLRYIEGKELGNILIGIGGPLLVYPTHTLCYALFTTSLFSVSYLVSSQGPREAKELDRIVESYVASFVIPLFTVYNYAHPNSRRFFSRSHEKNKGNIISMIGTLVGLLGYVLGQYWLREKSIPLLVMFSSFAIHWLATLALTQPPTDFGILNFLIGVILDCAISLFGLRIFTWIVLASCVVLVLLRRKLDSVALRYPRARTSIMSNWLSLEKKIIKTPKPLEIRVMEIFLDRFRRFIAMEKERLRRLWSSLLCADNSSMEEKRSEQEEQGKDELIGKFIMKNRAGKGKESKDDLIDKLRNFTLQQLGQRENGKEEGSRDELIHTLYRLYFRLCKEEEKGKGEQTTNKYQIALCLYQLLCLLHKKEKGKEKEKEKGKEVEENEKEVTEEAQIIRLCRLIFGMLSLEEGRKEVKIDIQQNKEIKEVEELHEKELAKEAQIVRLCRLILGQLFLKKGKGKEIKDD